MSRNKKTKEILICGLVATGVLLAVSGNAKADFIFGTPENLGPTVNSSRIETEPSISSDGLDLFFDSSRSGGYGNWDLWVSSRATTEDDWGRPVNLGSTVNSSAYDLAPSISADSLSLYFSSNRSGGFDVWFTTRVAKDQPWEAPVKLQPPVNSSYVDVAYISPDGLELYIGSDRPGGSGSSDLWVSTRVTTEDDWGEPVNLGPTVNTASEEMYSSISTDGRMLFFSESETPRAGTYGTTDIWVTARKTRDDDWGTPVNLAATVNSSSYDRAPSISADGSMLYFYSDRSGNDDLWQAPILPIVDFNADGIVNADDMCVIVDHWGENYPLCDIGPMPWGDGIVDVQDLIVLSEHLFEEEKDSTLIAHWALDETEGMFATDSVGNNDAFVVGGATWQPSGGRVDGALELNGVDGCAILSPVLNPTDGSFSIFAWINGGAPGQVVVSQQAIANWLVVDADGKLMTELKSSDQLAGPLHSDTIITDGQWHRIGLVWDGLRRTLCVDGVAVAEDTQPDLVGSQMGLYIGVGKNYDAGTFFSGLIDDVRIYNRAVSP